MPNHFDLIIKVDQSQQTADFQLLDEHGVQLAFRQTDFRTLSAGHFRGLFDLRNFVRYYVEEGEELAAIAEVGVCIAEEVLGEDIFERLWASKSQRTLRIQLPGATENENHLAAALARVPWEIARPSLEQPTLGERALVVRVVHDMRDSASQPLALDADEALRVLFVFAEARGSRPLGARQERREVMQMLEKEVYPQRRVVAHFLSHGVTRERLKDQIRENGGYHIVHWSGHGSLNLLELAKSGGGKDHLSGEQLLDLFTDAGGFLPGLFFLSACHSGDILRVRDWSDFMAIAQGKEPGAKGVDRKDPDARKLDLAEQPGFTGTAHALLQGGVPSVVAMRYAVGDDYARELAVEFYRGLLAHAKPKTVAVALTLARQAMLDGKKHDLGRFAACDHATPVLYGAEHPGLTLAPGQSPDLNQRNRRLHYIAELTQSSHEHFVGRTWELAGLGADFIGARASAKVTPVAVITGLGGMGKTALVAEALSLWEKQFEWVLLYQAKPTALGFEATLRDIHIKLMGELGRYHDYVKSRPADAIYRDADGSFTGPERLSRLTRNLLRALKDEPILIVLDNFETNLKSQAENTAAICQDPDWDRCLELLAKELPGASSRVLVTSRRPLAALTSNPVLLGPLPAPEAALYLRAHPHLSRMMFGGDTDEQTLARRLLSASRFHPLLMDRLATLAAAPLRGQLLQALQTLEQTKDFTQLPALFATLAGDVKELAYLEDALAASLDQLIRGASPEARLVLWIVAVANDPVAQEHIASVWSGEPWEKQNQRKMKSDLARLHELPLDHQSYLKSMPAEVLALLDALPTNPSQRPALSPLLQELLGVGLISAEHGRSNVAQPDLTCHELVRDRIRAWMAQHPYEIGEFTENAIRLAYADWLEAAFKVFLHHNVTIALQAGSRALIYCVQAGAWKRLSGFAGAIVSSTSDSRLLASLIPHLQTAAESAPHGNPRWSCLGYLADAISAGRPDLSLVLYEKAACLAREVAEAGGEGSCLAWSDLAWISGNWANALAATGRLDEARERHFESAEASKAGGRPEFDVIFSELEMLRIDIMQGYSERVRPKIEALLSQVQGWWEAWCAGTSLPDSLGGEVIVRTYIGALDVAKQADSATEDWDSALRRQDAVLEVERRLHQPLLDIADSRMNRANILVALHRFGEARQELEECLALFQNDSAREARVRSILAALFAGQNDINQAVIQERRALALREQFEVPSERAVSHHNLAAYLQRFGEPDSLNESQRHRLAALVYTIEARMTLNLRSMVSNYRFAFRQAEANGTRLTVPRLADLLADPAFATLAQWVRRRAISLEELQSAVDMLLDKARHSSPACES